MVASFLVESAVRQGAKFLADLDRAECPITAALWAYLSERKSWWLLIATPWYDELGPLETYKRFHEAARMESPFEHIFAISPREQIIQRFRKSAESGLDVSGWNYAATMFEGEYVKDVYIYRI